MFTNIYIYFDTDKNIQEIVNWLADRATIIAVSQFTQTTKVMCIESDSYLLLGACFSQFGHNSVKTY